MIETQGRTLFVTRDERMETWTATVYVTTDEFTRLLSGEPLVVVHAGGDRREAHGFEHAGRSRHGDGQLLRVLGRRQLPV